MPNSPNTKQRIDRIAMETFVGDYEKPIIFSVYHLLVPLILKDNCNYCSFLCIDTCMTIRMCECFNALV